ncbi:hypothetical protein [Novosphingobium sp.]|uniref:hypothetical protein n=2 Tax=unclassified Novosphingobium TaxID=2644732 RepID=UPI002601D297|nr:hypothetical protein [Novosphingobium sp.]
MIGEMDPEPKASAAKQVQDDDNVDTLPSGIFAKQVQGDDEVGIFAVLTCWGSFKNAQNAP